jgi:mono/diheme cytochrome c family protein
MSHLADKLRRYSPRFSPAAYKGLLIAMLAGAFVVPLFFVSLPFIEFFNDMAVQPKGKTQGLYSRLTPPERVVERPPVEGALPHDYVPYRLTGNDDAAAQRAGAALTNPVPVTMDNLQRGRKIYHIYCITCHGEFGLGNGPVVGPNRFPAPPSLHTETARNFRDGYIFHLITRGRGNMPAYADQIETLDRWNVIHYVRALQRAFNPQPQDLRHD